MTPAKRVFAQWKAALRRRTRVVAQLRGRKMMRKWQKWENEVMRLVNRYEKLTGERPGAALQRGLSTC